MSARTIDLILPAGLLANRPDPSAVPAASLYPALDTQTIYRNSDDGTAWADWLVIEDFSTYVNAEEVRDIVALFLTVAGATVEHFDETDELRVTLPGPDVELIRDTVAEVLTQGTGVTITKDDLANTVTIAVAANVDAEVVRDLIGTTLVPGEGVTIDVDDAANTVTISSTGGGSGGTGGTQVYRGPWSSLAQVSVYDLADGAMPSAFTVIPPPYGGGYPVVADGNGDPTSPAKVIYVTGLPGGQVSGVEFTVPAGVTSVRWKWQLGGAAAQWESYRSNVAQTTRVAFSNAFTQETMTVATGDVVKFLAKDTGNNGGQWRLGYIELLAANDPYQAGQVVSHLGKLWRSTTSSNATTPGAHASWVEVLTGYTEQPGVFTLEAAQTVANIPADLPAGTLVVQKQA